MIKRISLVIALFSAVTSFAQNTDQSQTKSSLGVNVNPAYFVLGGYSLRGIYHMPKRWSFSVNIEGGLELPDDFRDAFFEDNEAVDVDWDYAIGLEARYRLNKNPFDDGFYVFGTIGFEGWTVNEIGSEQNRSFDNWFASAGIGYNWYPFEKKNFNLGLSYNIIFILNNTENQTVGNTVYAIDSVVPPSIIPSNIHIGWRFN